jgi:hypothetical protein
VDIRVRALGHEFARAVQNRFGCTRIARFLGGHDGRNQVQCLDIAVQKAGVLAGNQGHGLCAVGNFVRCQGDPEFAGHTVLVTVGALLNGRIAARHLVVDKELIVIHFPEQAL